MKKTLLIVWIICQIPRVVGAQDMEEILQKTLTREKPLDSLVPSWMDVSIEHRTRYETFNQSFQRGLAGSDQQIAQRTRILLGIKDIFDPIRLTLEIADFRAPVADRGQGSQINFVDRWDIFQLHADIVTQNFLGMSMPSRLEVGRLVMDFAKGRLIAGHRFGSFTPSFDGGQWFLGTPDTVQVRTFLTRPVQRQSNVSLDSSVPISYFWGVDMLTQAMPFLSSEVYYFGLSEGNKLSKRELSTLGFRLFANPSNGHLDYEVESMYQIGKVSGVHHFAHRHHGEVGYTFPVEWQPRLVYLFDFASGNSDSRNNFDFLFAKRRAEYGPTGILGIIFPSNILSPAGFRFTAHPTETIGIMVLDRHFWLANARGQFVGSDLQDSTGMAGSELGNLLDTSIHWQPSDPIFHHAILELGFSHFFKGAFFHQVPLSPGINDVSYFYSMVTVLL
jgi:Alginate export